MARSAPDGEGRQQDLRRTRVPFFVGVLLLASSWALARWAPIPRVPEYDLEDVSVGVNFLVAGALPWCIQLAGIAMLFLGVSRYLRGVDRRCVVMGAAVPLLIGSVWWTSLIAIHWSDNPLEAIEGMLEVSIMQRHGDESVGQGLLHDVIGPLTGTFMLRGAPFHAGMALLQGSVVDRGRDGHLDHHRQDHERPGNRGLVATRAVDSLCPLAHALVAASRHSDRDTRVRRVSRRLAFCCQCGTI